MTQLSNLINSYIQDLQHVLGKLSVSEIENIYQALGRAREKGKTIFVCGNGGSASTASHMVCDLSKNVQLEGEKGLKMVGLNDNIPALTAYANDQGYKEIFEQPLKTLMSSGDILIAISASGKSENVLRAVQRANDMGGTTIGMTGYEGGNLKDIVDLCVVVPSQTIERIEDVHLIINHLLTMCLRQER